MCNESRPERGAGRENGIKEEVTGESAGWMTLALALIAAMIRGDQEKWVRMGDLMSEGHREPSINLTLVLLPLNNRSFVRSSKSSQGGLSLQQPDSGVSNASCSIIVRLGRSWSKNTGITAGGAGGKVGTGQQPSGL
jgi:hypothetical protein